jgi:hypothetical protein
VPALPPSPPAGPLWAPSASLALPPPAQPSPAPQAPSQAPSPARRRPPSARPRPCPTAPQQVRRGQGVRACLPSSRPPAGRLFAGINTKAAACCPRQARPPLPRSPPLRPPPPPPPRPQPPKYRPSPTRPPACHQPGEPSHLPPSASQQSPASLWLTYPTARHPHPHLHSHPTHQPQHPHLHPLQHLRPVGLLTAPLVSSSAEPVRTGIMLLLAAWAAHASSRQLACPKAQGRCGGRRRYI